VRTPPSSTTARHPGVGDHVTMTVFPQVLAGLLSHDPGRPLVTYYDRSTGRAGGERTELSVTTYANCVAKTSSLLADELDLEPGSRLLVDLPSHWLGAVFLGAAWNCGLVVCFDGEADAVVTGPDGLARWGARAADQPVLACALLPLAIRFAEPLPQGVLDYGVEVWSQPDAYAGWPGPAEDDAAVDGVSQGELWRAAAAGNVVTSGGRLLSEVNPASPSGVASFAETLVKHGSLVLVTGASPDTLDQLAATERVTARLGPA
jgi:uncharacterized protein (TIGR03089 family)